MSYNVNNVDSPEIATRVISGLREGCTAYLSLTDGNDSGFNFSTLDDSCIGAIVKNYMCNIDTDSDSVDDILCTVAYMCESLSQYLYGLMCFNRENYNILKSEYLPEVKKVKSSSTKSYDEEYVNSLKTRICILENQMSDLIKQDEGGDDNDKT